MRRADHNSGKPPLKSRNDLFATLAGVASLEALMTEQQLHLFNGIGLVVLVFIAALTRPTPRRLAGAVAGGAAFGVIALGIIALGEHVGWWHMAITWEPYFLMLLLIDFTLCAFVYLITWRIVRRFAWRGLAVCVAVAAVIGPARDYWYRQRFTEWGAYEPGIAPLLAVSATYVVMIILGHGVMRLIAGPSCADRLARRPWETILRSTDGRISVDESTANGKK